jgi:NADPH-dependent 2,4-dienoyl-CoA reductase/sulfur reductase-like enzyme/nitrite reductase/ring-hydroxylating ferredoxin subunit
MESHATEGPDLAAGIPTADLADGSMVAGHVGKDSVLLARIGDEFFAIGGHCTHYGGPLGEGVLSGDMVRCPWHHACFSLRTGEAIRAPAFDRVSRWRVETSGGRLFVRDKLPAPAHTGTSRGGGATGRFVIVGGGAAGFAAAQRLRHERFGGDITILSADDVPPVDRPNLSKDYLAGKAPEDWVFIKPKEFYEEHGIALQLGARVASIDPRGKIVRTADGGSVAFDKLLLATGAEPLRLPIPGADAVHVFTLRSLADSRAIIAATANARSAIVIGASFIGLEVAASLTERGLKVHVVAPEARPLERVFGPDLGDMIRAEHEKHGVVFHLGRTVAAIQRKSVTLDNGTRLDADLVIMGVGVRPRTELAQTAGLKVDNGVLVDAFLETNAPGIFAAGDIARFPYALAGGGSARIEHWVLAERLGQVAALNMLGAGKRFAQAPFFWSMHYGLSIRYVGFAPKWSSAKVIGDVTAHDALVEYRQGPDLVAVAAVSRDRDSLRAELELERAPQDCAPAETA